MNGWIWMSRSIYVQYTRASRRRASSCTNKIRSTISCTHKHTKHADGPSCPPSTPPSWPSCCPPPDSGSRAPCRPQPPPCLVRTRPRCCCCCNCCYAPAQQRPAPIDLDARIDPQASRGHARPLPPAPLLLQECRRAACRLRGWDGPGDLCGGVPCVRCRLIERLMRSRSVVSGPDTCCCIRIDRDRQRACVRCIVWGASHTCSSWWVGG